MKLIRSAGLTAILLQLVCAQAFAMDALCKSDISRLAFEELEAPLPQRLEPANRTSGRVPHVQIDAVVDEDTNELLRELAFSLPGVERRPTVVSLPGGLGMWLIDGTPVRHPEAIVGGREFTHIHVDGSLHAPLPFDRAIEAVEQGWAERHPWAERFNGWDGLVMVFSPRSSDELAIVFRLIVESYNHVTGQRISLSHC